jgi:hypothetical protein
MDGTDVGMLWNCSEEDGKVGSLCEEEALSAKMETETLIDKGRYNLTRFVYQVYAANNKTFFTADILFLGGSSQIWINTFSFGRRVLFGGGESLI